MTPLGLRKYLRRYWIEFDVTMSDYPPPGTTIGCGVTAYDLEDALELIRVQVFGEHTLPGIRKVVEDVDISTLDKKHVLVNIELPITRGVWFPKTC